MKPCALFLITNVPAKHTLTKTPAGTRKGWGCGWVTDYGYKIEPTKRTELSNTKQLEYEILKIKIRTN